MKANELMIGDLVMSPTITPELRVCRIKDVNGSRDFVGVYDINDEDEYLVGKYSKDIEPITLAEDILKANGFKAAFNGEYFSYKQLNPLNVFQLHNVDEGVFHLDFTENLRVRYVHQLQHALRLCGLVELADNFKVC